jgi:hypothetical protein
MAHSPVRTVCRFLGSSGYKPYFIYYSEDNGRRQLGLKEERKERKVVKLPSNWDATRKARLKKGKQGTYKIPKRKTGTVCPKVGSTPTSCSWIIIFTGFKSHGALG